MPVSSARVQEVAQRLGKSERTIWRWVKAGCDLSDESLAELAQSKAATAKGKAKEQVRESWSKAVEKVIDVHSGALEALGGRSIGGDALLLVPDLEVLPPPSDTGAAAALKRLEEIEASLYARVQAAIKTNKAHLITPARDDWLKVSESLRRYDLAIEAARRDSQEQMPKADALEAVRSAAEWMRVALQLWLSSETPSLCALSDPLEFLAKARKGIESSMGLSFERSKKSLSPVPDWALSTLLEAWAIPEITLQEEPAWFPEI